MTPPMHDRLRDYFISTGLTAGFKVQKLVWNDGGNKTEKFIVFRPNGGSNVRNELGAEYYVMVDVIGAVGGNQAADDAVQSIIQRIQADPTPSDCIGYIENFGGIPAPIMTTEGRLVYRLQFAIKYGE
ncbi:phage tail termination protein [Lonsdalea quercina]|uniref:phage tail termination protein n=1 Tax=Lonsdalea quercina TaxID=71657 RepID=UPI003974E44C